MGCRVGWTKKTQFLNFNLLIRILGQNILETNQKKNQPKILMFDPPLGGQHFAIQLMLKNFQNLQNVHTYIPIDAEFYADFKNVYFYSIILNF